MNKKILFLSAGIMMATASFAQKDKLNEASKELDKATSIPQDRPDEAAAAFQKGKEAIDAAVLNPETKDNPKTWLTKAGIYIGMQNNAKLNADLPYKEGVVALKKAVELNKKLESDQNVVKLFANGIIHSYNEGISSYNLNNFTAAASAFKTSIDIMGNSMSKMYIILIPDIDTLRIKSKMYTGLSAYYASNNGSDKALIDEGIASLNQVKNSPLLNAENNANIYLILAQAYDKKGDKEKQLAVIKEGKQKFPDDKNLDALDVNFALDNGTQGEAIKKMEESISRNPSDPELYLNLGILYSKLARPGGGAAPPANAAEYNTKAEAAYQKTLSMAPENAVYNYQLGSFYFNQAADLITRMNNLGGSKAEQKEYDVLTVQKDGLFAKALPALEKSTNLFKAKGAGIKGEERKIYFDALTGLKEIYSRTDQSEKANAVKELINKMSE